MANKHLLLIQGENVIFAVSTNYLNAYPGLFDLNEDELLVPQNQI